MILSILYVLFIRFLDRDALAPRGLRLAARAEDHQHARQARGARAAVDRVRLAVGARGLGPPRRGERPAGRAELLAKKGNIWAHAASAGTGTDP